MQTASSPSHSMLPESVLNILHSVNCVSRIVLKSCEGTERLVDGVDKIATLTLRQQQTRLIAELENAV